MAEPAQTVSCGHSERDLTRPWALRWYWCNSQVQATQTPISVTAGLSTPAVGTQAVRNAVADTTPLPASVTHADPVQVHHNIWFARGNPDLGPDGLRRIAGLAEHLKQTLREEQTVWLRGSTLAGEVADDMSAINQLSFDRAWAVRVALRARGIKAIRIRRPNGTQYGRKVIVSVR